MFKPSTVVLYTIFWINSTFAASQDFVTTDTLNGKVMGIESLTYYQNLTFYAFRGIPFAQPPIGDLRFKAPLPVQNWTSVYNASYARSECVQNQNYKIIGSEDCLHLNVYTTKLPSKGDKDQLPCIVWIHGGSFFSYSGDLLLHGADRFLNNEVMVVSVNYRLGVFGFLSTKDNALPGNYGLKDCILALEWVQKNVAFFGGDPNNVTIMGESAGAVLVHLLILSERAKGLFHKAIAESGDALHPWSQAYSPRNLAFKIGLINGIFTFNTTQLVEDLRQITAYKLQGSVLVPAILSLLEVINGLPFAPVIEEPSPEAVLTRSRYEILSNGNFSRVPFLHGFNSLEGRDFTTLPWYANIVLIPDNIDPGDLTPDDMNNTGLTKIISGLNIKNYYFKYRLVINDQYFTNYISDNEFVRGIIKSSKLQSQYCPVYLYRFAFTGGLYHKSFQPEGVSHAEELEFLWLNLDYIGLSNSTMQKSPGAIETAFRMVEMWTNFAKTGNPTSLMTEYVNVTWPVVNSGAVNDSYYLNIDTVLEVGTNPEQEQMQFWENLYSSYGTQPYNTY